MRQGQTTDAIKREAVETIRFQQSLMRLAELGDRGVMKKPAKREAEVSARQLAVWAAQLGATGTYS